MFGRRKDSGNGKPSRKQHKKDKAKLGECPDSPKGDHVLIERHRGGRLDISCVHCKKEW